MKQGVIAAAVLALLASFSNAAQWATVRAHTAPLHSCPKTLGFIARPCVQLLQVESGVDSALYCVTNTAAGYFACGGEGIVLNRTESGKWEKILQGGPTGNANSLYACTSTDDGERLWFAGVSGAIGTFVTFTESVDGEICFIGEIFPISDDLQVRWTCSLALSLTTAALTTVATT